MNKVALEAIRAMPEEYARDGTMYCEVNDAVVIANPDLPPIIYKDGKCQEIEWEDFPVVGIEDRRKVFP